MVPSRSLSPRNHSDWPVENEDTAEIFKLALKELGLR